MNPINELANHIDTSPFAPDCVIIKPTGRKRAARGKNICKNALPFTDSDYMVITCVTQGRGKHKSEVNHRVIEKKPEYFTVECAAGGIITYFTTD